MQRSWQRFTYRMPKLIAPSSTTRFLETIAIRGGEVEHLPYHQARILASAGFQWKGPASLLESLPLLDSNLTYKLRFIYSANEGIMEWSVTPYTVKPVESIRLVEVPSTFDYHLKYADRSALEALSDGLPQGELPLFVQSGMLTDTSYTNICLRRKGEWWVTPNTPLLPGTMRAHLLDTGQVREVPIPVAELYQYDEIALVNAMLPLGTQVLDVHSAIRMGKKSY